MTKRKLPDRSLASDFWTDERIALLRRWWSVEGLTASAIAERFGDDCTRNMVLGKASRLGIRHNNNALDRAKIARAREERKRLARERKLERQRIRRSEAKAAVNGSVVGRRAVAYCQPVGKARLSFFKVGAGQCHYPLWPETEKIGDVCGMPTDGGSFCPYHQKLCWLSLREAKRQAREYRPGGSWGADG